MNMHIHSITITTLLCKCNCLFVTTPHNYLIFLLSLSCPEIQSSAVSDAYETVNEDEISDSNKDRPLVSTLTSRRNVLVIIMLAMLCVLLGGLVVFLTGKVLTLRRRPRIKKRIVVNRPPVPFCRPSVTPRDQCEITIENCCNMNICETVRIFYICVS